MVQSIQQPFKHNFLPLQKVSSTDTPNGRFYKTPEGNLYQSVTTFLNKFSDNSWLDAWKEAVGEEKAKRVSTQASGRGTAVHNILEQIALNNPFYAKGQMPNNLIMAESIAKILRQNVRAIYGLEIGLWSDEMKIAGRADMLARWNDHNAIVDFKTSKYLKTEDKIHGYFLQCTLYAMMVEELTGGQVPKIVVLIGVDHEDPQVFIKNKSDFEQEVLCMVNSQ